MSAYIVSDEVINHILISIKGNMNKWLYPTPVIAGKEFPIYDLWVEYSVDDYDHDLQRLGQQLMNLNYEAVNIRYKKNDLARVFQFDRDGCPTLTQMYDAIGEYLYQCDEGDISEKNPLYAELEKLKSRIADALIENVRDVLAVRKI